MTKSTLSPEDYMAVWEAMMDMRHEIEGLDDRWNHVGTAAMRTEAIAITHACVAAWDAMTDEERDEAGSFDWEFAPKFLKQRSWN